MKILHLTIKLLSPFLFVAVCGILCSLWFVALSAVSSLLCNHCYSCYKTRVKATHYDTGAWWNVWGKGNMWYKIILSWGNKCTLFFYIMTPSSLEKNLLYFFQISLTKYIILQCDSSLKHCTKQNSPHVKTSFNLRFFWRKASYNNLQSFLFCLGDNNARLQSLHSTSWPSQK